MSKEWWIFFVNSINFYAFSFYMFRESCSHFIALIKNVEILCFIFNQRSPSKGVSEKKKDKKTATKCVHRMRNDINLWFGCENYFFLCVKYFNLIVVLSFQCCSFHNKHVCIYIKAFRLKSALCEFCFMPQKIAGDEEKKITKMFSLYLRKPHASSKHFFRKWRIWNVTKLHRFTALWFRQYSCNSRHFLPLKNDSPSLIKKYRY